MLTSLQNPLVKQLRKLQQAKARAEQGFFLIEGTHLLEAACAVSYPLEIVCCTEDWQSRYPQLWDQASRQAVRTELVSAAVLEAIATTVHPDGVIATAQRRGQIPDQRIATPGISAQPIQLGVGLETLQDPGNLGTIIRTAAAAGVDRLWLSADSVDLDHPKVLRASAGQWFRLPMQVSLDLATDLQAQQSTGVQIISTLPTADRTYWQVDFTRPTIVLLGNEGAGLSQRLAGIADLAVRIPQVAEVESLNVGIAAALLLYEARRQLTAARQMPNTEV
ncbi:MAG: RNA methyltransferase [Elainella sp. Prado103]|nr:RNA methyltransferase [Elainella sp. Prado103]